MAEGYAYEGPWGLAKAELINDGKGGASVIVTDTIMTSYVQTAVSIAALISSARIFRFGRSRSRKSEQIKIARELGERIDVKASKLAEITVWGAADETVADVIKILNAIGELSRELDYFSYLVQTHEIRDEKTLRY